MGKATAKLEVIIGGKSDGTLNKAVTQSYYSIERFASMTNSVTRNMLNAYQQGFNVAKAALAGISETYTSFEQAMADTAAIAGASVSEVERMTTAAREAGRTTTITAEDSAKALGYMALAGWSVDESIEGLMPVLRLAEATGADLQTTSDLVTDSLGAVGLQVKDLTQYMDMLVATNNNANTTAEMLMESLIKTGGAAVTLGANMDFNSNFGLDELMTAIGVLGSNGIKAEKAGTALNSILTRIGANPEARKGLDAIGVSIYDAQGNFIGLEETLYAIGEAMEGLNDEDKMSALRLIAGTRYASQLSYLMASLQDGASIAESSWGKLDAEIENSIGDLDTMNATATDTLAAASKRWISAVDDMKIGIGTTFGDDAKDLLNEFSAKMPAIIEMVDEFGEKHSYEIKDMINELGEFAENGAEGLLNLIEFTVDNSGTIFDLIKGLTVGQLALTGIANGARMFTTFMALPTPLKVLTATVAAVTALYTGYTILKNNAEKAHKEIIDANLDEHFGSIALSMEEIEKASENLAYKGLKGLYDAFEKQNNELEDIDENIKKTNADIDKANWKINLGIEMSEDEMQTYKSDVESLITDVQSYIETARYKSSLTDKILYGDNYQVSGLNNFYNRMEGQAQNAGAKLSEVLNDAFADGVLDEIEEEKINQARQRLLEIQQKIADTDFSSALAANTADALLGQLTPETFQEMQEQNSEALEEKLGTRKDAYEQRLSELDAAVRSHSMTQADADKEKELATLYYYANSAQDVASVAAAETGAIDNVYSNANLSKEFDDNISRLFDAYSVNGIGATINIDYVGNEFGDNADAVKQLTDNLTDELTRLQTYRNQLAQEGKAVDQSVTDEISRIEQLQIMAGDYTNLYDYLATQVLTNEDYESVLKKAAESGEGIPSEFVQALGEQAGLSQEEIDLIISDLANNIDKILDRELGEFTTNTKISIVPYATIDTSNIPGAKDLENLINGDTDGAPSYQSYKKALGIENNALGGIYDNEILTRVAEDGSSEAIIPINNAARSRNLWYETGARMGLIGGGRDTALMNSLGQTTNNSSNVAIQFSPTVYASGSATSEEIQSGLRMSMQEFKTMMNDYMRENARTAFGV